MQEWFGGVFIGVFLFVVAEGSAGFQPASVTEAGRDACATKLRISGSAHYYLLAGLPVMSPNRRFSGYEGSSRS